MSAISSLKIRYLINGIQSAARLISYRLVNLTFVAESMKFFPIILLSILLSSCQLSNEANKNSNSAAIRSIGGVERVDPRINAIIPQTAQIEILTQGHEWTEGPVWVPEIQSVLYSDIPKNAIFRWSEKDSVSLWLRPAGFTGTSPRGGESGSNGLLLDEEGRLLLAQHGDRRIARLESSLHAPESQFTTLSDSFNGLRFNSPNDLARRSNGDLYFTDPPYGLEGGMDDPSKEMAIQGVYRLTTDGSVSLLIEDLSRPNGIAFSPDENTLYVANSDGSQPTIMAYPVHSDGSI